MHVRNEIARIVEEAARQARSARRWSAIWSGAFMTLGLPSTILAALAGSTGLASADLRVSAAILALISAGLTAASGFLRSDQKALDAKRRESAWLVLEAEARLVAGLEGYGDATAVARAWSRLLEQRKQILAGGYESALGEANNQQVRFTGPYIAGPAQENED